MRVKQTSRSDKNVTHKKLNNQKRTKLVNQTLPMYELQTEVSQI